MIASRTVCRLGVVAIVGMLALLPTGTATGAVTSFVAASGNITESIASSPTTGHIFRSNSVDVREYASDGSLVRTFGLLDGLYQPGGISGLPDGRLVVAPLNSGPFGGTVILNPVTGATSALGMGIPRKIAADPGGTYVYGCTEQWVFKWNVQTDASVWAVALPGPLPECRGIAYRTADSSVVVADRSLDRIIKFASADGAVVAQAPLASSGPSSLAADGSGDLFVTNYSYSGGGIGIDKYSGATLSRVASFSVPGASSQYFAAHVFGADLFADAGGEIWKIDLDLPVVDLTPQAPREVASQSETFDASGSYLPFGSITSYSWDTSGSGAFIPGSSAQSIRFTQPGSSTIRVRVVGSSGLSHDASTTVTTTPATAAVQASPTPAYAGRPVSLDATASALARSSVEVVEWDLDGDGSYETAGGTSLVRSVNFPDVGSHRISVRLTRSGGVVSTADTTVATRLAPPDGLVGVSVNGGDVATNSPDVMVDLVWPAFAVGARLANDGGLRGAGSLPLASSVPWKLQSSGPERLPKTVYARFEGGESLPVNYTDDIILDQRPPSVVSSTLELKPTGQNESHPNRREMAKRSPLRSLRVVAKDDNSGIAAVQLARSKSGRPFFTRELGSRAVKGATRFRGRLPFRSSAPHAWIRVQDKAGNWSRWKRAY